MLLASEPARTAAPIGKSASAFKLNPVALLATLDDERMLELLIAMLETILEAALEATLDLTLELDGTILEGALELDGAILDATLELPPTTPYGAG